MTADFVQVCEGILQALTDAGRPLQDFTQHKYAPWDPEALQADGHKHVAVWPSGETAGVAEEGLLDTLDRLTNLDQQYEILVWESSGTEASRGKRDEKAAANLLELHNDSRDVMLSPNLEGLANYWRNDYLRTDFPERASSVRWFRMTVRFSRTYQASQ